MNDIENNNDRILIGVDGSAQSVAALQYAARLATALDVPLHAIAAWGYPLIEGYYDAREWSPEEDARTILAAAIETAFGDEPPARLTTEVVAKAPARALIDASAHAGMLVVGSRGRGGFVGLVLGSVSQSCAAHAHCPVLVIHPSDVPMAGEVSAA